jgi:hypothetical protein
MDIVVLSAILGIEIFAHFLETSIKKLILTSLHNPKI